MINPTVDDVIQALRACAVESPQKEYPCMRCYLYPFSKDGRMSTGRICFEHLTLDVIDILTELKAKRDVVKEG